MYTFYRFLGWKCANVRFIYFQWSYFYPIFTVKKIINTVFLLLISDTTKFNDFRFMRMLTAIEVEIKLVYIFSWNIFPPPSTFANHAFPQKLGIFVLWGSPFYSADKYINKGYNMHWLYKHQANTSYSSLITDTGFVHLLRNNH